MASSATPPPYTHAQLAQYFTRIGLPTVPLIPSYSLLASLMTYHLSTVPFENIKLHYSTSPLTSLPPQTQRRLPSLDPSDLFTNIVETGRGGYCMELNAFFGNVLRSLGFEVRARGARVHAGPQGKEGDWFSGWSHMVNLVRVPDSEGGREEWWMVDVGFGGQGPIRPLPVDYDGDGNSEKGRPEVLRGIGEMVCRVRKYGTLGREGVEDAEQKEQMRVYETRVKGKDGDRWAPLYAFTRELAFQDADYEVMNWYVATHPNSWFTKKLVCVRFIREGEKIVGELLLDGEVFMKRTGGDKEILERCRTDTERAEGLRRRFGIGLTDGEVEGIVGLPSALE